MFTHHRNFTAALLLMTAITASTPLASEAWASCSEADKELYRQARQMVIPYDTFSNSVIVSVSGSVLTVTGYIDSHRAKREIAENLASLQGVKTVRNDVIVRAR